MINNQGKNLNAFFAAMLLINDPKTHLNTNQSSKSVKTPEKHGRSSSKKHSYRHNATKTKINLRRISLLRTTICIYNNTNPLPYFKEKSAMTIVTNEN